MKISNELAVEAAPQTLFDIITDVERVAHCLPGATLRGREGDSYLGSVKVKVGPISALYRGSVRYVSVAEAARRVVLDARGQDEHGSGNAEARVEVSVSPDASDTGSLLRLDADLVVRGRVAQFGRGVLGDVSQGLMARFARNIGELLATEVAGDSADASVPPGVEDSTGGAVGEQAGGRLDALALVARPVLARLAPAAVGLLVGAALGVLTRRRGGAVTERRGVLSSEDLVATLIVDGTRLSVPVRRTIRVRR
jgi:uncharacterized protein